MGAGMAKRLTLTAIYAAWRYRRCAKQIGWLLLHQRAGVKKNADGDVLTSSLRRQKSVRWFQDALCWRIDPKTQPALDRNQTGGVRASRPFWDGRAPKRLLCFESGSPNHGARFIRGQ